MNIDLAHAAKPWPKSETYEHWHEVDRSALERMRLIVAKN